MSTLLKSLSEPACMPGMVADVIDASAGQVCEVCGLQRLGHAPESRWLNLRQHPWTPVAADAGMVERARELTAKAYRARKA